MRHRETSIESFAPHGWLAGLRRALIAGEGLLPVLRNGSETVPIAFGAVFATAVRDHFGNSYEIDRVTELAARIVDAPSGRGLSPRNCEVIIRGVLGEIELCDGITVGDGVYVDVSVAISHELLRLRRWTTGDVDSFLKQATNLAADAVRHQPELQTAQDSMASGRHDWSSHLPVAETPQDKNSSGPLTTVARWQRATLLGRRELREELRARLNGGDDDEVGFLQASFELAVRRFFPTDQEVRDIPRFVQDVRASFGSDNFGGTEAEVMIRSALGDTSVSINGIDWLIAFNVRCLVVHHVFERLAISSNELDELLVEAETVAAERGWRPTVD